MTQSILIPAGTIIYAHGTETHRNSPPIAVPLCGAVVIDDPLYLTELDGSDARYWYFLGSPVRQYSVPAELCTQATNGWMRAELIARMEEAHS